MKPLCQPVDDPYPVVVTHALPSPLPVIPCSQEESNSLMALCTSTCIYTHYAVRYNLIRLGNVHTNSCYMNVMISLHPMTDEDRPSAQDHEEVTVSLH